MPIINSLLFEYVRTEGDVQYLETLLQAYQNNTHSSFRITY